MFKKLLIASALGLVTLVSLNIITSTEAAPPNTIVIDAPGLIISSEKYEMTKDLIINGGLDIRGQVFDLKGHRLEVYGDFYLDKDSEFINKGVFLHDGRDGDPIIRITPAIYSGSIVLTGTQTTVIPAATFHVEKRGIDYQVRDDQWIYDEDLNTTQTGGYITKTRWYTPNIGNLIIGASPGTTILSSDLVVDTLEIGTGDILQTDGFDITVGGGTGGTIIYGFLDASQSGSNSTQFIQTTGYFKTQGAGNVLFTGTGELVLTGTSATVFDLVASGSLNDLTIGNGLIGYWRLDEGAGGAGTITVDSSGNGNDGVLVSTPTWSGGLAGFAFSNPANLDFAGGLDFVRVDPSPLRGLEEFSVSIWVKHNLVATEAFFSNWASVAADRGILLRDNNPAPLFQLETTDGNFGGSFAGVAIVQGQWNHIVAIYDGANMNVYLDNTLSSTTRAATGIVNPTQLFLGIAGAQLSSSDNHWTGEIDDVRLFDRVISAEEVSNLFNQRVAASSGSYLIGSTIDINGDFSLQYGVLDNSGNNDITIEGSWINALGTYIEGTETVTFDGTPGDADDKTICENGSFNNFTIDNGLVGYWKLDKGVGGSGTRIIDSSGNGNDGVMFVEPVWSTDTHTGSIFHNPFSVEFDDVNDHIVLGTLMDGFTEWTVSGWIKMNVKNANDSPFLGDLTAGTLPVIRFSTAIDDFQFFANDAAGSYVNDVRTTATWNIDTWYFITLIYDGTNAFFYQDAVDVTSGGTVSAGRAQTADPARIGADFNPSADRFDGFVDDVRLYNRALSSSEVSQLFTGSPSTGSGYYALACALDVNGDLRNITGTLDASGALAINVAGNWWNVGDYIHRDNTVTFDGTNQILTGSTLFNSISKTNANNFTWDHSSQQSVSGALTLLDVTLRSSRSGSAALLILDSSGSQNVRGVDVADNDASGGQEIDNTSGTDSGNTTNWLFLAAFIPFILLVL